ncbi:type II toxin-antitoxin system VapB family antitoxin [Hydrogenophaga sp. BPS33]|uniref:type II toxin-antitoxin system VapB family antitoxin n=1 Tax=Hydrogenophaga sp. BPS33 TaxID=2651974 RepID=UPI0013200628|nr:type II toxin-antitoxin system VapB family antitoxin [Hydrogenophaga sp. BPS33]QHE84102.1 type II toxin-antitoxin system VapB family antitoxin [Hydrogenophaga sp. BPS33]
MRTNIVIDDKLMAEVMATGNFKTKREAVEEGLRLLKRRHAYDGLRSLRGKLHWDDSDEGWARYREEQMAMARAKAAGVPFEGELDPAFALPAAGVHEERAVYKVKPKARK